MSESVHRGTYISIIARKEHYTGPIAYGNNFLIIQSDKEYIAPPGLTGNSIDTVCPHP